MGLVRFVGRNSHSLGVCFSERANGSSTVFCTFRRQPGPHAPWYELDQGVEGRKRILDHCNQLTLLASSPKAIDWPRLIEKYEKEMFDRARIAVQESQNAAEYFRNLRSHS